MAPPTNMPALSSWPSEVRPHEPSYGWFQRLAQVNSSYSAIKLAVLMGLNGRNLDPAELLEFCLTFPVRNVTDLIGFTPVISERQVVLGGQTFNSKLDFSIRRPRVCPRCLTESRHYRNWFDLQLVGGCPIHGLPLTSGPADDRLSWWHPMVGVTPSGIDLAGTASGSTASFDWERYVLGRTGVLAPLAVPILDAVAMDEVARVAVLLGSSAARRGASSTRQLKDRAALAATGFSLLANGREHLEEAFRCLIKGAQTPGGDHAERLRYLTTRMPHLDGSHLADEVRAAFATALQSEAGRGRRVSSAFARSDDGILDLKQFSQEIGLSPAKTRQIAQRLGLAPQSIARTETYRFTPAIRLAIRDALQESVCRKDAALRLGLKPDDVQPLVNAGLIAPITRMGDPGPAGDRYLAHDVAALVSALNEPASKGQAGVGIAFSDYCGAAEITAGEALVKILQRDLRIVGRDPSSSRVLGLVLDMPIEAIPTKSLRRRKPKAQNGMSYGEAAAIIGAATDAVGLLVASGHLAGFPSTTGRLKGVCSTDVERFATEYAPARAYMELTGLTPTQIHGQLKKANVPCLSGDGLERHRFVRRDAVISAIGWGRDSDVSELGQTMRARLADQFRASGSANQVLAGLSDVIKVRSADGSLTADVTVCSGPSTAELNVPLSATTTPRRFAIANEHLDHLRRVWPEIEVFCNGAGTELVLSQTFNAVEAEPRDIKAIVEMIDDRLVRARRFFREYSHPTPVRELHQ